jgi:hypothetical protein
VFGNRKPTTPGAKSTLFRGLMMQISYRIDNDSDQGMLWEMLIQPG